jgi:excisionase family DNA binding protein
MSRTVISELATPSEAAAELRVSVGTIKRWIRAGQISAVRTPGGHWRIPLSELRAMRVDHIQGHHRRRDARAETREPA